MFDEKHDSQIIIKNLEDERAFLKTPTNEFIKRHLEMGIQVGMKEGMLLKSLEIAKILLNKKISAEEIYEITGLTIEDIDKYSIEINDI